MKKNNYKCGYSAQCIEFFVSYIWNIHLLKNNHDKIKHLVVIFKIKMNLLYILLKIIKFFYLCFFKSMLKPKTLMFNFKYYKKLELMILSSFMCLVLSPFLTTFENIEVGSRIFITRILWYVINIIVFAVSSHVYLSRKYITNKE